MGLCEEPPRYGWYQKRLRWGHISYLSLSLLRGFDVSHHFLGFHASFHTLFHKGCFVTNQGRLLLMRRYGTNVSASVVIGFAQRAESNKRQPSQVLFLRPLPHLATSGF